MYTDSKNEAIMNRVQGKGVKEYGSLMTRSLSECYRVLRPGHWMLLVFMNSSSQVWGALKGAIASAGFEVAKMDVFDKQHGTFKQFVSDNTAGMDLVLHCLKPQDARTRPHRNLKHNGHDVINFLASRRDTLPTNTFLHVGREEEIDYRTLYSEWVAETFGHEPELLDFAAFRDVVRAWLKKGSR
jgi:hypothetical protein